MAGMSQVPAVAPEFRSRAGDWFTGRLFLPGRHGEPWRKSLSPRG